MSEPWCTVFVLLLGAWLGALVLGLLALRLAHGRLGRDGWWPFARLVRPLLDLVGTWAGALAAVALLLGRRDYGFFWAGALFLVALMVFVSLYDRAVLVPMLDRAFKRLGAGAEREKWEDEWASLERMGAWGRGLVCAMGATAVACGLLA